MPKVFKDGACEAVDQDGVTPFTGEYGLDTPGLAVIGHVLIVKEVHTVLARTRTVRERLQDREG